MPWVLLLLAGALEVMWAIGLKHTDGFTRFWPSFATISAISASLILLAIALKDLPLGTAYAIWTGVGVLGTSILGIILFDEPASALRLSCIALILTGIVGLKLS